MSQLYLHENVQQRQRQQPPCLRSHEDVHNQVACAKRIELVITYGASIAVDDSKPRLGSDPCRCDLPLAHRRFACMGVGLSTSRGHLKLSFNDWCYSVVLRSPRTTDRKEDKVGLGEPREDPLFVNTVCPPSYPAQTGFPVKVYVHWRVACLFYFYNRALWELRLPILEGDRCAEMAFSEVGDVLLLKAVVALTAGRDIREVDDAKWDQYIRLRETLSGET
ncbi:hypothetical protein BD309DRAFT_984885 [Dichomitus squalens]|nr:hypothetical protein BD309DRAFT_984885 [Dichomitus squalens]